jgi:O-antigen/teichoic acid export membrane protein
VYKKIKDLCHSKFSRNVALVFSGALVGQLITFACSPILTRLYGPEAFGIVGTLVAIASVVAPIATLAYPVAITLPKQNADAKRIAVISFYMATLISLLSLFLIILFKDEISVIIGIQSSKDYLLFVPIMIFFLACLEISQQWTIRARRFPLMSKIAVNHSFIVNFCKVGAGLLHPAGITLIMVSIMGSGLQAMMYTLKQIKFTKLLAEIRSQFEWKPLIKTAIKYEDFPLYRMPQVFVLAMSQNLPLLMLASLSGVVSAGYYGLARTVMVVPVMLLGNSVGNVFYPRIHQAVIQGENTTLFLMKATLVLAVIAVIPFSFLFLFSPWLFSFVFGIAWRVAGDYASWLSLFFYFSLLSKPALAAVAPLKLQKHIFYYELLSTALKLSSFLIGVYLFSSDEKAVMFFSITGAISYLFIIIWIINKSKSSLASR